MRSERVALTDRQRLIGAPCSSLAAVQVPVGRGQHFVEFEAVMGVDRGANRHADRILATLGTQRAQAIADSRLNRAAIAGSGICDEDGELVTADPCSEVSPSYRPADRGANGRDSQIAGSVAMQIVELFSAGRCRSAGGRRSRIGRAGLGRSLCLAGPTRRGQEAPNRCRLPGTAAVAAGTRVVPGCPRR